jgi:hypothetical protein
MLKARSICIHPDRPAIDTALAAGEAFRNIQKRFGTSTTALHRHQHAHLRGGEALSQEPQPTEVVPQESSTPTLAPEVQEALAEYRKVHALFEALWALSQEDWRRWSVLKHVVMLPMWRWKADLESRLRAWGTEPRPL